MYQVHCNRNASLGLEWEPTPRLDHKWGQSQGRAAAETGVG